LTYGQIFGQEFEKTNCPFTADFISQIKVNYNQILGPRKVLNPVCYFSSNM